MSKKKLSVKKRLFLSENESLFFFYRHQCHKNLPYIYSPTTDSESFVYEP